MRRRLPPTVTGRAHAKGFLKLPGKLVEIGIADVFGDGADRPMHVGVEHRLPQPQAANAKPRRTVERPPKPTPLPSAAVAPEPLSFMVARFIGGVGVGIATVASPLSIADIAPPALRGRLAGMFQFNIVFGILIAFVFNYLIGRWLEEAVAWRWMLGVEAIPALLCTLLCFTIPESPRWLVMHGNRREEAIQAKLGVSPGVSA